MNALVIDQAPLDAIRSLQQPGSENLLNTILRLYLDQSTELGAKIGRAVAASSAADLREAAHSLKSSSANVGAMQVSELARELELAGIDGNLADAAGLCDRLEAAIRKANAALATILASEAA
jgi:HPt (histidine-containing phosphotransfer) domain-containing protein